MTRIFSFFTILLLINSCGNSQISTPRSPLTGDVLTDVGILLPKGEVLVDIMGFPKPDPRKLELMSKYQQAIKEHYEWFIEYSKNIPEGESMPFHPNLGLTEEEYEELISSMNNVKLESSSQKELKIIHKDNTISFESGGKLMYLNDIEFHLDKNTISWWNYTLSLFDSTRVTDEQNALGSSWKGYTWVYESTNGVDVQQLKDIEKYKAKQYKITIGRLDKNGKTFLNLKGREYSNGAKQVDFELPLVF
ncbi:hypothetical protein MNBD_BACTEROID06-175 [hydrothermal vent metagenome]|uniref:Uncharacterized protein n=1 Tax=hydrothermal vent metagenome TaxID=652676 RepID=A0A3B0UEJ6_9ZZZZ